jgi:hypothetical protein
MDIKKPVTVTAKELIRYMDIMAGENNENLAHLPPETIAKFDTIKTDLIAVRSGQYSHLPFDTLADIAELKRGIESKFSAWRKEDEKAGNPESERLIKAGFMLDHLNLGFGELALGITDPRLGTKAELREQTAAWPPIQR